MPKTDRAVLEQAVICIAHVQKEHEDAERRIAALEAHVSNLEERLNDRGVFSGDYEHSHQA